MACRTIETPTGRAIVCGMPKPKRCAFCGDPSSALCDWPTERAKSVDPATLKRGDRIFPFSTGDAREILSIKPINGGGTEPGYTITWEWRGAAQSPYVVVAGRKVRLAVSGTCDKPCCARHHRSVDDGRDYCQDHWRQEEIG